MKAMTIGAVAFVCLLWTGRAEATITCFMPGDARFVGSLTAATVETLQVGQPVKIGGVPAPEMGLCGYRGFSAIEIVEMPPAAILQLKDLHQHLRRHWYDLIQRVRMDGEGQQQAQELNPFLLLVYSRDFSLDHYRMGLKYNENWNNLPEQPRPNKPFGTNQGGYFPYIKTADAVIEDWRNGPNVAPLPVNVPEDVSWTWTGPLLTEAAQADWNDVQLLILPNPNLKVYFQRQRDEEFYRLTDKGMEKLEWIRNRKTQELELRATPFPEDSAGERANADKEYP